MAFVRVLNDAHARQGDRQARRADRARRVAHVRHGGHVPPARDLLPGRPALPARGRRAAHVLPRGQAAARSSRRASTSPARCSSWIAAATSYSNHGVPMIPFYIYYSMFGFQRVGDLAWAAGDTRARGFLLGGTAGRTTLNGEGLQHEDGHSHCSARLIPNCVAYDPTYGYEVAVIVQDGLRRMFAEQEDVFYYLTVMNENYRAPGDARGRGGGDPARACTCCARRERRRARVQLLGLGHDPARGAWPPPSCCARTSASPPTCGARRASPSCAATGMEAERWNLLHPTERAAARRTSSSALGGPRRPGDRRHRLHPRLRRPDPARTCRRRYRVLGTDGFGRSDCRGSCAASSRSTATTSRWPRCSALADEGAVEPRRCRTAIERLRDRPATLAPTRRSRWPRRGRRVPDIGDFTDVPVIEILVAPGDTVAPEDPLVTLESDKATMDVPAPQAGVVQELKVNVGDTVSEGSVLLTLVPAGADPGAGGPRRSAHRAGRGGRGAPSEAAAAPAARRRAGRRAPPPPAAPAARAPARRLRRRPAARAPAARAARRRGPRHVWQDASASGRRGPAGPGRGGGHRPPGRGADATAGAPGVAQGRLREVRPGRAAPLSGASGQRPLSRMASASCLNLIPHGHDPSHNEEADITELEAFRKRTQREERRTA